MSKLNFFTMHTVYVYIYRVSMFKLEIWAVFNKNYAAELHENAASGILE